MRSAKRSRLWVLAACAASSRTATNGKPTSSSGGVPTSSGPPHTGHVPSCEEDDTRVRIAQELHRAWVRDAAFYEGPVPSNMTLISRIASLVRTVEPRWTFLTNHARVLLCIAEDPGVRLREIGERVGIMERAAHRLVRELDDAGYVSRERHGRRNRYAINPNLHLPEPLARRQRVGDLLAVLTKPGSWSTPQSTPHPDDAQVPAGQPARTG